MENKQTITPLQWNSIPHATLQRQPFQNYFSTKVKGPCEDLIFPCDAADTAACSLPTLARTQAPFNSHQSCYGNPSHHLLGESWQLVHFPWRQLHSIWMELPGPAARSSLRCFSALDPSSWPAVPPQHLLGRFFPLAPSRPFLEELPHPPHWESPAWCRGKVTSRSRGWGRWAAVRAGQAA